MVFIHEQKELDVLEATRRSTFPVGSAIRSYDFWTSKDHYKEGIVVSIDKTTPHGEDKGYFEVAGTKDVFKGHAACSNETFWTPIVTGMFEYADRIGSVA